MNDKKVEDRIRELYPVASSSMTHNSVDRTCWDYYNEHYDDGALDYLTKSGKYVYPARLRKVGQQRPLVNLLVSQQVRRPFPFGVKITGKNYAKKRREANLREFISDIQMKLHKRIGAVEMQMMSLEENYQQMAQFAQQQPQDEEQAMLIAQVRKELPQMRMKLDLIRKEITIKSLFGKKELEEKERFLKYSRRDFIEEALQVCKSRIKSDHNLVDKGKSNFKNMIVTGRQAYYVNYHDGENDITFEALDTMSVTHPQSDAISTIEDGPWCAIHTYMDIEEVKALWGHLIPKEKLDAMTKEGKNRDTQHQALIPTSGGGAVFANRGGGDKISTYSGSAETTGMVKVVRIWYKEGQYVYAKKVPNPHKEGRYFFHIIKEEDQSKLKKDETLVRRWVQYRYQGIVINDDIYVDCGKDTVQMRDWRRPSLVKLPIIGPTFNDITNRPYSLIWSTKDLQDLYRIVHYMRELVIAMSGVRSKVVDWSQIPSWMTPEEHRYYMKTGTLYIETVDESGRKVNSSFNQWRDFDDSLSPSIQFYQIILDSIKKEIADTMGISQPRIGQRTNTDQVGTNQQSQMQSELITEVLYHDHDQVMARALTYATKLKLQCVESVGSIIEADMSDSDVMVDSVKLPKELYDTDGDFDFQFVVENTMDEVRRMEEARQFAYQNYAKGMMTYSQVLSVINSDSVRAMEKKLEHFESISRSMMEEQSQRSEEAEMEKERQKIEFAKQYDMQAKQIDAQAKEMSEKVKMAIAQMQDQREREKMQLDVQNAEADRQVELTKIATEATTERDYLGEERRNNQVMEVLEGIRLQMEAMTKRIESVNAPSSKAGGKERVKD